MTHKQLALLFLCNLLPYIVGNALMSVLPLYLRQLGADASSTGFYMAFCFAVLAISTLSSGWLSNRFQRRKLCIVLAAGFSLPVVLLMGQAQTVLQLALFNATLWFLFGIGTTMVNILTGLYADEHQRGRIFGVVSAALAVSQVISGTITGPLVDRWGFPILFMLCAGLYGLLVLVALLLEDKKRSQIRHTTQVASTPALSLPVIILLVASVLAFSAHFMTTITRPLAMDAQNFNLTAITGTVAISGLINLPIPFIMGWLSDRAGRRVTLLACYGLAAIGVGLILPASTVWHFWIAQTLIAIANASQPVSSALITDLVEPEALSASLSRFTATPWIGAVIGFTGTGLAIQNMGLVFTSLIGMSLALLPVLLVYMTRPRSQPAYTV